MDLVSPENAPKSSVFGQKPREIPSNQTENTHNTAVLSASLDLENLDLDQELSDLYAKAKLLLGTVVGAIDIPANQQAQVFNSVVAILDKLAKTRTDVYNSERLRKLEQSLIRTLQSFPRELQEAFLKDYERSLSESGLSGPP